MELECIVDFRGTANWRRDKAAQYPEDTRNTIAADILDKLAEDATSLEGSDLHRELLGLWEDEPDDAVRYASFNEVISEELRLVGFGWKPATATDFLQSLLETLKS